MFQLVYLSRSKYTMSDNELDDILAASRRNNANRGVTGMLLYAADTFLQVLEGPKLRVEALFDELYLDDRHQGARVLYSGPIAERSFDSWSMGFARLDEHEAHQMFFFDLAKIKLEDRLPSHITANAQLLIDGFAKTKLKAA